MTSRRLNQLFITGLGLVVLAVLFESLFLDRIVQALDLRVTPPFAIHTGDAVPRSMNFMSMDLASWLGAERFAQLRSFSDFRVPLWNASEGAGQPLLASLGDAPFYPTRLLDLVLPAERAIAVSLALHIALLATGVWLVMRRAGLHPAAAALGAVTMAFSGYVSAHYQVQFILRAIAWLPWMHLAFARLAERPSLNRTGVLALVVGLSFLVGFPQVSCLSLYSTAIFVLPRSRRALTCAGSAVVIGGLLAAVHLLPATELLGQSFRSEGLSSEVREAKSLVPRSLIGLVSPQFFGSPVAEISVSAPALPSPWDFPSFSAWQETDSQNTFEENTLFVGLIPLCLAILGCLRPGRARRVTMGLALVLLIAMAVPGLSSLVSLLPGMKFGSPKRVLFLAAYALAWLAALELDRIVRQPPKARSGALLGGGAMLFAVGLIVFGPFERWLFPDASPLHQEWFQNVMKRDLSAAIAAGLVLVVSGLALRFERRRLAIGLLVLGATLELTTLARHINPAQPAESNYRETPAITWLLEHGAADDVRILSFGDHGVLNGPSALRFGLRSVNAHVSLLPRRPGELMRAIEPDCIKLDNPGYLGPLTRAESLTSPILDLFGVRFAVASQLGYRTLGDGIPEQGLELVYGNEVERVAIYERKTALPPAFFVPELAIVPDAIERLAALSDAGFEPARLAILESERPSTGLAVGTAHYRRRSPEELIVDVEQPSPGFLVISETLMPGWRCTIDGEPAALLPTNHAFMGVRVPAGAREVRVVYAPISFTFGWITSLIALALILLLSTRQELLREGEIPSSVHL